MLTDLTVKDFLNKVAGSDPVPGGGSIAALNGALASALAAMVANLTIGKKKYAEVQEDMQAIAQEAERLMGDFTADIDRDSDAYDRVFACFKMPKETDEEKAARSAAIQEATKYAAQVPLEVARRACALMPRVAEVALKGNQNAVTDACVAMMSARNAVLAAVLNVRINLSSLKDAELVTRLQAEADGLAGDVRPGGEEPIRDACRPGRAAGNVRLRKGGPPLAGHVGAHRRTDGRAAGDLFPDWRRLPGDAGGVGGNPHLRGGGEHRVHGGEYLSGGGVGQPVFAGG